MPDELAAELAAMEPWKKYLLLRLATAEADQNAGQITDIEYKQVEILCAHLMAAADEEKTVIEVDADELGVELRKVRDPLAHIQKKQVRLGRRQGPSRRPRRESRRRRSVRTRRAKARAPSGDDSSSGHVGEPEESSGCSTSPQKLDLLDAVALSLGWERAA